MLRCSSEVTLFGGNENATFHFETKVIPEGHGKHFTAVVILGKRNIAPTVSNQVSIRTNKLRTIIVQVRAL